ncbi:phage portal protein [Leucobacter japonicus]|uniref:phage portal protein n=1 Tax=Leucobacter japonicus TaxID=1461259 RepID=UPI0006A7EFB3|nr:phage portal protein [Leucobacter japonicus]
MSYLSLDAIPEPYGTELKGLFAQLQHHQRRNDVHRRYYDYKSGLKDLGIAIPPQLRSIETVLGWSAKGVEGLVKRSVLDGFSTPSGVDADSIGLTDVFEGNQLGVESRMAHTDAAVASCAFGFVHKGDEYLGEPRALISVKSSSVATARWDTRKRALASALSVIEFSDEGKPVRFNLYMPGEVIAFRWTGLRWDVQRMEHDLGMPVEVLPHKPSLSRPFGKSRISRAVMALTDSGVRTLLRSEVSAEFFSAPQRYALGVDEDTFIGPDGKSIPAWQAVIGRMFAVGRDENGDLPSVGQFSQQSFEPHFAQIRQLASLVSSEFNMTPRSFGIVQDNPESADAIIEAKEDLVLDAKEFTDTVSPAWKRLVVGALRIHDDSPVAREVYRQIRPHFRNPALPSVVSASDAVTKQVSSFPWLAETDEALEMLGYDRHQIDSMQATRRRASARELLTVNREAVEAEVAS